ncbi:uncharacterized protein LOC130896662 isoform X1 [Diorhabda carinulata]|uniref:uncharacterized protein LOC130896662 isoform X1 n=1 Tax=Diorhabda carinulata TaxID=1163345 RepID=UPI0025A245EB|nr:uncharacterized protein LOC130896662 isoform X1 [Diorhabda carinulata]
MANQQTTDPVASQNQPLNNPPESANNENSVERMRTERITKIKQKVLPGVKITLLISVIIYIAMFIIGILGVHHCPAEENIPLFLIATGAVGLITKITTYMREHIMRHFQVGYMESSMYTVEMVFLILGAYWVYKEYPPSYVPGTLGYCRKSTYMLAFVYITIILSIAFVALAGFLFFLCCICCLGCALSRNDDAESGNARTGNATNGGSVA